MQAYRDGAPAVWYLVCRDLADQPCAPENLDTRAARETVPNLPAVSLPAAATEQPRSASATTGGVGSVRRSMCLRAHASEQVG